MRAVAALAALTMLCGCVSTVDRGCLRPGPATLTGKVFDFTGYGPPGYGETPEKDQTSLYLALALEQQICVSGVPVSVVELTPPLPIVPEGVLGQPVRLTGRLALVKASGERPPATLSGAQNANVAK